MRRIGIVMLFAAPLLAELVAKLGIVAVALASLPLLAAFLTKVERRQLPAVALVVFALVPVTLLPVPRVLITFSPALGIIAVWLLRSQSKERTEASTSPTVICAGALATWVALGVAMSPHKSTSVSWALSFLGLALLPVALGRREVGAVDTVQGAWRWLAAGLSLFAIAEAGLLHSNPVYGWAYRSAHPALVQHWSVYRATTTLGHPLLNSLFLAVALCICLGMWLRTRQRRDLALVALVAAGLFATGSRGGLLAAAIGALVVFASDQRYSPGSRVTRTLVACLAITGLAALSMTWILAGRANSNEGAKSLSYRTQAFSTGTHLARKNPVLGAGPGLAASAKAQTSGPGRELSLENAWVELAVALGIPGLLLTLVLLGLATRSAIRRGRPGVAGAIVAYFIAAGSFNALEGHRPAQILLGLLLICAVGVDQNEVDSLTTGELVREAGNSHFVA